MLISLWSAKGGSGTTVTAVSLALSLARTSADPVVLVDLDGDVPAVLGLPEPDCPGITDWMAAASDVPADAVGRLEVPVEPGLSLIPRGREPIGPVERAEALAALFGGDNRPVVADLGALDGRGSPGAGDRSDLDSRVELARGATLSLLVTRPCYLALRRVASIPVSPSGIILASEPGRALGRRDVEEVVGVPVRAEVAIDPAIARAVDAGLLATRLPRGLERTLARAA